jgi:hypothetical protein
MLGADTMSNHVLYVLESLHKWSMRLDFGVEGCRRHLLSYPTRSYDFSKLQSCVLLLLCKFVESYIAHCGSAMVEIEQFDHYLAFNPNQLRRKDRNLWVLFFCFETTLHRLRRCSQRLVTGTIFKQELTRDI